MLTFLSLRDGQPVRVDREQEALWVHLQAPTDDELASLQQAINIPLHIMKDVQDPNEMPHLECFGDRWVVFLDVPVTLDAMPKNQTRPFCIILEKEKLYTLSAFSFDPLSTLSRDILDSLETVQDLVILLFFSIMSAYIEAIKRMENQSNWEARDFKNPPEQSTIFFELLDLQKSMVDFQTSVEANHTVLQTMQQMKDFPLPDRQQMWMNNLLVESSQVANMCSVFSQMLDATGNIAESIVSNNLNDVMKTLTSLTILFSVPTIITAIFTMNTAIPSAVNHIMFPLLFSVLIGVLVLWLLKRRKLL